MQNNIMKFEPDQPQVVAFKYKSGKPFQKGDHSGYTYTLANGLVAFFPEAAHKEIEALHIDAGTPVQICKLKSGGWDIQRIPGGPPPGRGYNRTARCDQPQVITDRPTWGMSDMRRALFTVIDDAAEAEKYAAGKGLSIRFDGCDIRTMANTIVIQGGR